MSILFRILGPVELGAATPVPLRQPKVRLLLAILLLRANSTVSYDRLAEVIWDQEPPPSARSNLRTYAVRLRRAMEAAAPGTGSRLVAARGDYSLSVRPGELDAEVFSERVSAGRTALANGDPARADVLLRDALSIWRGPAGDGLPATVSLAGYLSALNEERVLAMEDRIEARLALGDACEQISVLRRMLTEHPLRERSWAALMTALYRIGDVGGALDAFVRARRALVERIGIEPGPELCALHRSILSRDPVPAWPLHSPHRRLVVQHA